MAAPKKTAATKKPAAPKKKAPAKKPAAKKVDPTKLAPLEVPVTFPEDALEAPAVTESIVGDPGEGGGDIEPRSPLDIDPKVQAGGVGGAVGLVALWLLNTYGPTALQNPPEIIQGALLLIIAGIFAYAKKNAAS